MRERGHRATGHSNELRRRIAIEAARLMTEQGIQDFQQAKRKAAESLRIDTKSVLPKNSEIEAALREYQRLFLGAAQPQLLRQRREAALNAMRFFACFEPRLVGTVFEGTADIHSAVCLHVFSEDPGALSNFLQEHGIPFDEQTRHLRPTRDTLQEFLVYQFFADNTPIDITLLPLDLLRQAPLDCIDERPMRRASLIAVEALLAEPAPAGQN